MNRRKLEYTKYIGAEFKIIVKERVEDEQSYIKPLEIRSNIPIIENNPKGYPGTKFTGNKFYITVGIKDGQSSLSGMYLAKQTNYDEKQVVREFISYLVPL
jgi:hypothetical protein